MTIDRHRPALQDLCRRVTVPVLFTIERDDERFDRNGQIELYERLGSTDKRLHAYPGATPTMDPRRSKRAQLFCIAILKSFNTEDTKDTEEFSTSTIYMREGLKRVINGYSAARTPTAPSLDAAFLFNPPCPLCPPCLAFMVLL